MAVITVFHAELAKIWENDSLEAINMLQTMGIRGVGARRKSTIMKSTRNVVKADKNNSQNALRKQQTTVSLNPSVNVDKIEADSEEDEDDVFSSVP